VLTRDEAQRIAAGIAHATALTPPKGRLIRYTNARIDTKSLPDLAHAVGALRRLEHG
jgi:hypothetical protein